MQLIQPTVAEVSDILAGTALLECRGYSCAAGDLIPEVVAKCAMDGHQAGHDWFWCAPRLFCDTSLGLIVGSGCFKGAPVLNQVEIGYGVAEAHEGKGYASAGVARMVEEAFAHGGINAVIAETSVNNPASQRVLEKNGFTRTGQREDPEDGLLIQWRRSISITPPRSGPLGASPQTPGIFRFAPIA
ncbi:MAG: GNAT family N-acetyltransferase [Phycisphaerales bacterium]